MQHTLTIILNWNNPQDTILVAQEVLSHHNSSVVLVDNDSADQSLVDIQAHFQKMYEGIVWQEETSISIHNTGKPALYLVSMKENYGFAKAINKIIKAIPSHSFQFVWLLNNDAIPAAKALVALETEMFQNSHLGFAGSVILDYQERQKIQCCGVQYFPFIGISKLVLKNQHFDSLNPEMISNERIDFQHGASLLVRLEIVDKIGLMDERFFLYFEEQDWQIRGKKLGYANKLIAESCVFHKGSMSTEHAKHLFFFFYNSSAVVYSLKHNNLVQIFFSFFGILLISLKRTKLKAKSLLWALKGIVNGMKIFTTS
jgi:GT2 family glycosyltransferase